MNLTNSSTSASHVLVVNDQGARDFIHVAARGRVQLPVGFRVDPAWASAHTYLKFASTPVAKVEAKKQNDQPKQFETKEGSV